MKKSLDDNSASNCPLCTHKSEKYHHTEKKLYLKCPNCSLVFLHPKYLLNKKTEKSRYDLHQNNPQDPNYRKFLSQLSIPIIKKIKKNSSNDTIEGLDFGCGPGPTLSIMLQEAGLKTSIYDPFYYPNSNVLKKKYHFITASEVAEHFHTPQKEFTLLFDLLKPGGLLGIMTKIITNDTNFAQWHYKNDDTHVSFYSKKTFQYIEQNYKTKILYHQKNVTIFQKHNP